MLHASENPVIPVIPVHVPVIPVHVPVIPVHDVPVIPVHVIPVIQTSESQAHMTTYLWCRSNTSLPCIHCIYEREMYRIMQELLKEAEALCNSWTRERRKTVKLFRDLADVIQALEEQSRVVKIAGGATSVVGGLLTVAAGISAIPTGGATLPIAAAAGSAFTSFGSVVLLTNEIKDEIVQTKAAKLLDKAIVNDRNVSGRFWKVLQTIGDIINCVIYVDGFGYNCYNSWKAESEVPKSENQAAVAFSKLSRAGQVKRVIDNIGLSSICLLWDVKTLVETLVKVHKGEILKVVSGLRDQAQKLEDEIPVYKNKVELLKRRAKEKELELLKQRAKL